jgi:hypothetical protein
MRRKAGQLVAEDDARAANPSSNSRTSRRQANQPYASEIEDYSGETTTPPRADRKPAGDQTDK